MKIKINNAGEITHSSCCDKSDIYACDYSRNDAPYEFDGVGHYQCINCGYKVGRFSRQELGKDELENVDKYLYNK